MAATIKIRTYSELRFLKTFSERFEYLKLNGTVAKDTFGFDRYLNQIFYHSPEWASVRRDVIARDNGCDMGLDGYEIGGHILIHHMNPITVQDVVDRNPDILDPKFLICVSKSTHDAIHYGDILTTRVLPTDRKKDDTKLW